jgi:tetratricopeptide (TPR) repeat protein
MDREILKFTMPMQENPVPADYAVECETASAIVEYCTTPELKVTEETMQKFAPTSPWIAWQLGMIAEATVEAGEITNAIKLAAASVLSAEMCSCAPLIYGNLLTTGNILLQLDQYEDALHRYKTVLRLPFAGGESARAAAHLAMGSIYRMHEIDLRKSIYHYEHAMRFYGPSNEQDKVLRFWQNMSGLYKDAKDVVGMMLWLCQTRNPQAQTLIVQLIDGSLDKSLALRTRLMRQRNLAMANFVKTNLLERKHS